MPANQNTSNKVAEDQDLSLDMNVRDGYIAHEKASTPVSNLHLDFRFFI